MKSPFWRNSTWAVAVSGILMAVAGFIGTVQPSVHLLIHGWTASNDVMLLAIGTLLGNVGSVLARAGGVASAAHVEDVALGTTSVLAADQGKALPAGLEPTVREVPFPPGGPKT